MHKTIPFNSIYHSSALAHLLLHCNQFIKVFVLPTVTIDTPFISPFPTSNLTSRYPSVSFRLEKASTKRKLHLLPFPFFSLAMDWALHASTKVKHLPPPPPQPFNFPPSPQHSIGSGISPSILLIIVILAVIFFISGLLHLLIRYLMRPTSRDPDEMGSATALEGQLQQLFHLHDAGVDQTFIDALPIFLYRAIIGLKDPFDCAVCLCEFEGDDKLRLLPKCSHAFHLDCIDTWLLSHSTCPLCRTSLLSDFNSPGNSCCSPLVLVLESAAASERSTEICPDREETVQSHAQLGLATDCSIETETPEAKVVAVRLGKIKNMDVGSSDGKLDGRRCHSMGSYEYVMDEGSQLQVAINPSKRKPGTKKPRNRLAMSECDPHSRRGFKANFEPPRNSVAVPIGGDARITARKESFSVSKIWMRPSRGDMITEGSRRAHSFRLPLQQQSSDGSKLMIAGLEKCGSEVDLDVEVGSCNNSTVGSVASEAPSFTTRTLLWIMGRQSKVGSLG